MQLTAVATMPDGTKHDVTKSSTTNWDIDNPQTATVNKSGVVVGVNVGVTKVKASYQGATTTVSCTVTP